MGKPGGAADPGNYASPSGLPRPRGCRLFSPKIFKNSRSSGLVRCPISQYQYSTAITGCQVVFQLFSKKLRKITLKIKNITTF
jgi:hypothetical protein